MACRRAFAIIAERSAAHELTRMAALFGCLLSAMASVFGVIRAETVVVDIGALAAACP